MNSANPPRRTYRLPPLYFALSLLCGLAAGPPPRPAGAQSLGRPRIVNGVADADSPEVGAVLEVRGSGSFERRESQCTGTLIGCSTFLVAAHCVCSDNAATAAECAASGTIPVDELEVFLPHAGVFFVTQVSVSPDYEFEQAGDFAVLTLDRPVTGIAPALLHRAGRVAFGTSATIVGYGVTSEDSFASGLKRAGTLVTSACPAQIGAAHHICWEYDAVVGPPGTDSNSCYGDSGGPLFVATPGGRALAGVTSGGEPTCDPGSVSWNAEVFSNLAFIDGAGGGDVGTAACGAVPAVGSSRVTVKTDNATLTERSDGFRTSFVVPSGTKSLRVGLNGMEFTESGFGPPNDFDLYLNQGSAPGLEGSNTCADESVGTWAYCEVAQPAAGDWHVLARSALGNGDMQLTITTIAADSGCVGDCDGDGATTVDEIVRGINIALGDALASDCAAFDVDSDGAVTVDEIVRAINIAVVGCD